MEPLEGFLAAMGLQEKFVRLMEMPGYAIASNLSRYAVLDNGDLAKAYTITGVSSGPRRRLPCDGQGRREGSIHMTDEVQDALSPCAGTSRRGSSGCTPTRWAPS